MTMCFVRRAITAVWQAYSCYAEKKEKTAIEKDTQSWLYDAACLLEIVANDDKMISMLDDYYVNYQRLPWNQWHDSLDEKIRQCKNELCRGT